ncbi:MAG: ABC transporter permease [Micromonosporaceae bacterium]|nr:ABC transporter permease [Micromonosporaceae bacterium]
MTTAAAFPTGYDRATAPGDRIGALLAGTGTLIRFNLRRDRIRLPLWLAGITLTQVSGAASYPGIYPTAADRQSQAVVFGENPAMKAMTGPGYGLEDYTFGAMMSNEYLSMMVILGALMAVFMVVRHTRAEEETGRAELVRSSVVGRYAHLTAALTVTALASIMLGVLIAVGMGSLGIETVDWKGSCYFGAAYTVAALVFAAIAAVTVQITEYGRAASGIAGGLIGAAYVIRAIGDVAENGLSWLSPIGWVQASGPYVLDRAWPLLLGLAVAVVLVACGYALNARRDLGAGLRVGRGGAATASRSLGTPLGFAWRLQRSSVLWWSLVMVLAGLSYGAAVDVMQSYEDNEMIQKMVESIGGASLTEAWISMVIALLAIVCTVFAVIAALRPSREENAGRAESVLATGLSRTRWLACHLGIAMAGGALLLLLAGLGLGGGAAVISGDSELFWNVLGASVAYAPALWLTAAVAVAAYGLLPRATGLAWAVLGYAVFIVYFGGLLQLPAWTLNLSPYHHVPMMPVADFEPLPLVILAVIAAGLVAVGLVGFRRRDLRGA